MTPFLDFLSSQSELCKFTSTQDLEACKLDVKHNRHL